jgi:branched-subunit amino acid aminotransferase/4-amino-4-deoxychorismate lyase
MGIPGVKAGLDIIGMRGGTPRAPLTALNGVEKGKILQLLEELGLDLKEASIR